MSSIVNLKKAVDVAVGTAKEGAEFFAATNSWAKIQIVMGLSDNVMAIAGMSIPALYGEYKNLDAAGMAELKAYVAVKFDIKDDTLEAKIESTFNWLLDVAKALEGGLGLAKLYA
jgi:hypothetical protein